MNHDFKSQGDKLECEVLWAKWVGVIEHPEWYGGNITRRHAVSTNPLVLLVLQAANESYRPSSLL